MQCGEVVLQCCVLWIDAAVTWGAAALSLLSMCITLASCWQKSTGTVLSGRVCTCLDVSGRVCICLDVSAYVCTCLDVSAYVWTCLDVSAYVWTRVWTCLHMSARGLMHVHVPDQMLVRSADCPESWPACRLRMARFALHASV